MSYQNNKFNVSALKWIEKFELPEGLYYVSNIHVYFEYILRKH